MIVYNLDSHRIISLPGETDAILLVDPDAVLTFAVAMERLQTIPRWYTQIVQRLGRVKLIEFPNGDAPE